MTVRNLYAVLDDFKHWINTDVVDDNDDNVILSILESASRYIDAYTKRSFYPRVQTIYHDVPDGRTLFLVDDLLEVLSLINGDGSVISSSKYNLLASNVFPKFAIELTESSNISWSADSNGNTVMVIPVTGIWGYHEAYNRENVAWLDETTLNDVGGISSSDTLITVLDSSGIYSGHLIRIDNELIHVLGVSGNDLTVERGVNGSVASAHEDGATIKRWKHMAQIQVDCLMIANEVYKRRFGENAASTSRISSSGVVIMPQDLPAAVVADLENYRLCL